MAKQKEKEINLGPEAYKFLAEAIDGEDRGLFWDQDNDIDLLGLFDEDFFE